MCGGVCAPSVLRFLSLSGRRALLGVCGVLIPLFASAFAHLVSFCFFVYVCVYCSFYQALSIARYIHILDVGVEGSMRGDVNMAKGNF